jgi:hypothetical protein
VLHILTVAHGNAEERRPNASRGELHEVICDGGISSVDIAFGAVNSRHREAREEDVGVVALRMLAQLAQLIAENSVQAKFAENPFHIPGWKI